MTYTETKTFHDNLDRYYFDSTLKDFSQLDTKIDASYFGNWIDPTPLNQKIVTFAEGDLCLATETNPTAFAKRVRMICDWYKKDGDFIGIDPMGNEPAIAAYRNLGLTDLLH